MFDDHELDLTAIDYRTLAPEEQRAVVRRIIQDARRERAKAISALLSRILFWRERGVRPDEREAATALAACFEPRHS